MRAKVLSLLAVLLITLIPQVASANAVSGATGSDGRAVLVKASGLPAWAWFDADITVHCDPPTGSGTSRQVDGFYLWHTRYDSSGNVTSQGYVGTTWTSCTGESASRSYHLQLVLQGTPVIIELVTERRVWPYSASSAVPVSRKYEGNVSP